MTDLSGTMAYIVLYDVKQWASDRECYRFLSQEIMYEMHQSVGRLHQHHPTGCHWSNISRESHHTAAALTGDYACLRAYIQQTELRAPMYRITSQQQQMKQIIIIYIKSGTHHSMLSGRRIERRYKQQNQMWLLFKSKLKVITVFFVCVTLRCVSCSLSTNVQCNAFNHRLHTDTHTGLTCGSGSCTAGAQTQLSRHSESN